MLSLIAHTLCGVVVCLSVANNGKMLKMKIIHSLCSLKGLLKTEEPGWDTKWWKKAVAILDTTYTEKGRRKIKDCPCIRSSSLHFMATERENLSTEQGSEVPTTHMNVLLCKWYESQGKFSPTAIRQLKRRMENGENTPCAFYATPRNNIEGVLSKPFLRQRDLSKAKC